MRAPSIILGEYATLRAMGALDSVLYRIIVLQGVLSALVGYVLGLAISLGIAQLAEFSMTAIRVTWELCILMLIITVAMCALAAVTSIHKVTHIQPAVVFRR